MVEYHIEHYPEKVLYVCDSAKKYRAYEGVSQEELAKKSGVSKRTIERFENGESIQLSNFFDILEGLGLAENIKALIPNTELTPLDYLHNKKPKLPQRARKSTKPKDPKPFKWGDEE